MRLSEINRNYRVLQKKEIKTKDGTIYRKLSLYNCLDDNFESLFVDKNVFDKCIQDKTHTFVCDLDIFDDGGKRLTIKNII